MVDKEQFTIRVENLILNKIRVISKEERRSLNAQIEYVLEKYVKEYEKNNGVVKVKEE